MSVASFCARCGYANVQGHTYCPNCGNSLSMAAAGVPPPTAPPAGYPPPGTPPPYPYGAPPGYPPPYYGPPAKRANFSTIFGDTFGVYAKDVLVYVGVFLLYGAVITGLTFLLTVLAFGSPTGTVALPGGFTVATAMDVLVRYIVLGITVALVGAVLQSILIATLTYFVIQRYRGAAVTLREAFNHGLPRVFSVLVAALLLGLLFAAFVTVPVGLLLAGALVGDLALVGLGLLLLLVAVIVLIYVYVALSLYPPVIVIEGKGALDGLKRSWELTRGRRLTFFAVILVLGIISALISAVIALPFGISSNAYIEGIGTIIATAVTGSWSIIWVALAYHLILSEPRPGMWPPPYTAPPFAPPAPPRT